MPSCALDRCVDVILSAEIVRPSRVSPRCAARFELGAIEVDERELARNEQARADREEESDAEEDPLRHPHLPVRSRARVYGRAYSAEGGSSIVLASISAALGRFPSRNAPVTCVRSGRSAVRRLLGSRFGPALTRRPGSSCRIRRTSRPMPSTPSASATRAALTTCDRRSERRRIGATRLVRVVPRPAATPPTRQRGASARPHRSDGPGRRSSGGTGRTTLGGSVALFRRAIRRCGRPTAKSRPTAAANSPRCVQPLAERPCDDSATDGFGE